MADSAVEITPGTGASIDVRTETTNGNARQVVVVGDPATNNAVGAVLAADPATNDYGPVVRPVNQTRGNFVNNASIQLAGTDVSTSNPVPVRGNAADNAAVSGNPVLIAGKYNSSAPTYDNGDVSTLQQDVNGNLLASLGTALQALVGGAETDSILAYPGRRADSWQATANFAANTAQTVKAAVTNKSLYVTDLIISSDGGAACNVKIQDNAGTPNVLVEKIYFPNTTATSVVVSLKTPILVASGNTLNAICSSATPNITVFAAGYAI